MIFFTVLIGYYFVANKNTVWNSHMRVEILILPINVPAGFFFLFLEQNDHAGKNNKRAELNKLHAGGGWREGGA